MNIIEKLDHKYKSVGGSDTFVEAYNSGLNYEQKQNMIMNKYSVSRYTAKNWLSDMRRMKFGGTK